MKKLAEEIAERATIEQKNDWIPLSKQIPYLKIPEKCKIKVIPPYNGVLVRFSIKKDNKIIDIVLDYEDKLKYSNPYYTLQFSIEHDEFPREGQIFYLNEVDEMFEVINEFL